MAPTSPTEPTTNSALTTCATISLSGSEDRVQRAPTCAIVDEVDSILIDEARTPLIISGPAEETPSSTCKHQRALCRGSRRRRRRRRPGDYSVDEKTKRGPSE